MLPCSFPCLPSNDLQGERAQGYHRQEASREAPKEGALVGGGEAHFTMLLRSICPPLPLSVSPSLPVFSFSIRLPFLAASFLFVLCAHDAQKEPQYGPDPRKNGVHRQSAGKWKERQSLKQCSLVQSTRPGSSQCPFPPHIYLPAPFRALAQTEISNPCLSFLGTPLQKSRRAPPRHGQV
jgi:hypothetical protein